MKYGEAGIRVGGTAVSQFRSRNRRKEQKKRRGIRFPRSGGIDNGYREARRQWQLDTSFTAIRLFILGTRRPTPRRQASFGFDGGQGATFCLRSSLEESVSLRPARIGSIRRVMAGSFCRPFHSGKTSCRGLSVTRKILGVLSIHYGCNVSPYAISLFPFLPFFPYQFCFLEDRKYLSPFLPRDLRRYCGGSGSGRIRETANVSSEVRNNRCAGRGKGPD